MSFGEEVIAGFDPAVENLVVGEVVGDCFDQFCVENDKAVGNEQLLEDLRHQLLRHAEKAVAAVVPLSAVTLG